MSEHEKLFTTEFLMSHWAKDYQQYCESGEDDLLLASLKNWSEKNFQKETASESSFIQTFFVNIWGYAESGTASREDGYTVEQQYAIEKAGQNGGKGKADLAIGWFGDTAMPSTPQVLCEFKDIRSNLDAKQNRKGNDRSPVEQCGDYLKYASLEHTPHGTEKIQLTWGIVTDMNEFRLYWKARMPVQYQRFIIRKRSGSKDNDTLIESTEESRKQRFLFSKIFHQNWLLNRQGKSPILALHDKQNIQEKSLEKTFYFEYRAYRDYLFNTLLAYNSPYQEKPKKLVRLTQKLLDRFLFMLFCEDMGAHLDYPVDLLRDAMLKESQDEDLEQDGDDFWQETLRNLFEKMRAGGKFRKHSINRFNGGLFAVDSDLDELIVPNEVFFKPFQGSTELALLEHKETLLYFSANYNFGVEEGGDRAIGLYTLGRIFEQSITDLEIMEAEAASELSLMKLGKRKTNGVYYTPEWVTAYIVEETLGLRLEEIKTELEFKQYDDLDEKSIADDHYKNGKPRKAARSHQYFELLGQYAEKVSELKILDPACGSGAFLIQALKRLLKEYEWISDEKARVNYQYKQTEVFDKGKTYREILAKNLYGVDVNAESVEITKLALWLHTVMPGQPLSSLDNNILCGNSLVDWGIEETLGELSEEQKERINPLSYQVSFADVFEKGGFDVVIGNPPYIKLQNMKRVQPEATEYWVKAKVADGSPKFKSTQTGNYDIYLPFTEQCIDLLNPQGRMGFIQPNVWAVNDYGRGLRGLLHETHRMDRWIDFKDYQIFDEAITYSALQFFTGTAVDGIKLHFAPKGGDDLSGLDWRDVEVLGYDELPISDSWQFMPKEELILSRKLSESCPTLEESCRGIAVGIQTSADNIYHLTKISDGKYLSHADKKNPVEVEMEDEVMKPLVSGPHAKRYQTPQTDTYLLFPYDLSGEKPALYTTEQFQNSFPKAWSYLRTHEAFLRNRERKKMDKDDGWWAYNYPKNLDKQLFPKLIVAQTVPSLRSCFDYEGHFYLNNVRVNAIYSKGLETGWYLLGVLNAKVANYVFVRIAKSKEGGYFEANKQFIAPLPIPDADDVSKQQVAALAEKLQELHTEYRDTLEKLNKRLSAGAMEDDTRTTTWIWSGLPDWKTIKKADEAIATELKGAALTKWAKEQEKLQLSKKLEKLLVRLRPGLKLTVNNDDGEFTVLADGIVAFDAVYTEEEEAPFISAQWKQVIRTTNITPSLSAEKLLSEFLKLKKTSNTSLINQILSLDKKLDQLQKDIDEQEAAMNALVYGLYGLSDTEIRQIEAG